MDTLKINKKNTKIIAHRGLSGLEKENTMPAFIAAGNKSYFGIECDIHKTKDGVFVVIHDDNTKRVSGINKKIFESTYEELIAIDLYDVIDNTPKPYLKIPTLGDYLNCCYKYRKHCVIELKDKFLIDDIQKILSIIDNRNYLNNTTFISFNFENLLRIKKINSNFNCQYLTSEYNQDLLALLKKYQINLNLNYEFVTKEIVKQLHENNLLINVWTVNDPINAEKFTSWGIDYLTTNILE